MNPLDKAGQAVTLQYECKCRVCTDVECECECHNYKTKTINYTEFTKSRMSVTVTCDEMTISPVGCTEWDFATAAYWVRSQCLSAPFEYFNMGTRQLMVKTIYKNQSQEYVITMVLPL